MTYMLQLLARDKQPQWTGILRTKEEAYNYVNDNIDYLYDQGYECIIMFRQDEKYRLFYENAAFMEEECDDDEEGEEEEHRSKSVCPYCEKLKSN